MVISPSVCKAVALFAPARHTVLSGCKASLPPKIFRVLTDGAEYLMVIAFPPRVREVSAGGLAGGPFFGGVCAEARLAATVRASMLVSARLMFIRVRISSLCEYI